MIYRIPHYVRDVKRMLGAFPTLEGVPPFVLVIATVGVLMLGVLVVEALLSLFVLFLVVVAIGLGVRFWWLRRAMPMTLRQRNTVGRTIEGEHVVIYRQPTTRKRKYRKVINRGDRNEP